MANVSVSTIHFVVNGYSRDYTDDQNILYLLICYANVYGDEGIIAINYGDAMSDDSLDDATIAQQSKSQKIQPIKCGLDNYLDILQYVYAENPNRRAFCAHMKVKYKFTAGHACKEYHNIENKITEGLEHKTNDVGAAIASHNVTDPRYPSGFYLNLFTDKSCHGQLFKLLVDTDWHSAQQISGVTRNGKCSAIMIMFSAKIFVAQCKQSFQYVDAPLIPIIVEENDSKWVEWLKIVKIDSNDVYVGDIAISFRYNVYNEQWGVQSIYLDQYDINYKHRLSGMRRDKYNYQLSNFKTNISKIMFTDGSNK